MTVISVANFLQAESHDAHTLRREFQAKMGGRPGVVPNTATFTDLKVTQRGAGANMSVDVAEGSCYVMGTESNYQGLYHCDNQGVTNVVITASDPTNPRRDMIVARIRDSEYGVAVTDEFTIEAIAGTPAGSPADPTIPANCIVLARVAVAAAASSITNANITDLRNNYTAVTGSALIGNQVGAAALGGIVTCLSTKLPTTGLYEGLTAYCTDTNRIIVYNGSAWIGLGATDIPLPQFFTGGISAGTATGLTAFVTNNNILTAPYPLTMVVEVIGDIGANGAPNTVQITITDESGNSIVPNGLALVTQQATIKNTGTDDRGMWSLYGTKDYAAGATCGFRILYAVTTSNIYIGAIIKVTFHPKAS